MSDSPIGVFDSGVGGLSVWRELCGQLPAENLIYLADQAHVPYGPRPLEQVQTFSVGITRFLLQLGCKLVVVACNTASAAALQHLRGRFPETPFVGMEPAVKPAVASTRTRRVGVLATPATFQGALFASVVERFAEGVAILPQTLPGLVERIEAGDLDGPETRAIVQRGLEPLLAQQVDTLVLGCTHYPFVISLIQELAGDGVEVIDPSPAIARQTGRLLAERHLTHDQDSHGERRYYTTGDPQRLAGLLPRLLGETPGVGQAVWHEGRLQAA
jgi:glutamate racemase